MIFNKNAKQTLYSKNCILHTFKVELKKNNLSFIKFKKILDRSAPLRLERAKRRRGKGKSAKVSRAI
ncbi:hypothetical protein CEN44_22010 [Fischerella muscicola CCMEE 5323]|uniref:Uncharacterized protein n=1 Tax=Fischerella muscicola CCMEE 5323 TaxID=2019572 RepID=A0A2N6JXZ4_FISMU|nr:hypothetical protein CEN44_22010 [Fischerella muscicola CCMEE 5323]